MDLFLEAQIEHDYKPLAALLRGDPKRWLPGAEQMGEQLIFAVGLGLTGQRVQRKVRASLSQVQPFGHGVAVHVEWQAFRHPELYPTLSGALRLERAGPDRCRLILDATYRPPAGRVGAVLDQTLMHHVAEASLRDFVARLVNHLAQDASALTSSEESSPA
jgi:hypothetical protein